MTLVRQRKEAVFYNGQQDLLDKAQRYLSDDTLRHSVAEAGRKRFSHPTTVTMDAWPSLETALRQ